MNVLLSSPDPGRQWQPPPAVPRLTRDRVLVWRATIDREPLGELLSPDETARANELRFPEHRRRFIAVHSMLRMMLAGLLEVEPREIEFSRGPHGKPQLAETRFRSGIRFNISHSGDVALFAFALQREVGVDVEVLRTIDDAEQLARRYFSPDEAAQLEQEPESNRSAAFLRLWTCKEACVKALGAGLSYPLDRIQLHRSARTTDVRWTLHPIPPSEGLVGATVVEGSGCDVSFVDWLADAEPRTADA